MTMTMLMRMRTSRDSVRGGMMMKKKKKKAYGSRVIFLMLERKVFPLAVKGPNHSRISANRSMVTSPTLLATRIILATIGQCQQQIRKYNTQIKQMQITNN
jgi:hypothetical protein